MSTATSVDAADTAKLCITLRNCILLLLRIPGDVEMLPRVLQHAQALQLPLTLRSMTRSGKSESIAHFAPVLEIAYRSLYIICGDDVDDTQCPCNADFVVQQLRDTLAALNHALQIGHPPVTAIGSDDNNYIPHVIGQTVAAASKLLFADDDYAGDHRSWLGSLVNGMREDITQSISSIDAFSTAAEVASASAANLSLLLESENNARAAADIKAALLQRECHNLKDELRRSVESAAASSSSSAMQLQLMASEIAQLQVNLHLQHVYCCAKLS